MSVANGEKWGGGSRARGKVLATGEGVKQRGSFQDRHFALGRCLFFYWGLRATHPRGLLSVVGGCEPVRSLFASHGTPRSISRGSQWVDGGWSVGGGRPTHIYFFGRRRPDCLSAKKMLFIAQASEGSNPSIPPRPPYGGGGPPPQRPSEPRPHPGRAPDHRALRPSALRPAPGSKDGPFYSRQLHATNITQ